jgi:hypothetical protein
MLATTDAVVRWMDEDVPMPSIWIVLAAAVTAINLRLILPIVGAFLGIGKGPVAHRDSRHRPSSV